MIETIRRRISGDFVIDPWGLDPELHDGVMRLGARRWDIEVVGADNIPTEGAALLVVQRRLGLSEMGVVAVGVNTRTGRRVRSTGIPTFPFAENPLRRVGGALSDPAEIHGLLRDGHVVSVGLGWSPLHRDPGPLAAEAVAPAVVLEVPVLPVAMWGHELGRHWDVVVGRPIDIAQTSRPVGRVAIDVAEAARAAIADFQLR